MSVPRHFRSLAVLTICQFGTVICLLGTIICLLGTATPALAQSTSADTSLAIAMPQVRTIELLNQSLATPARRSGMHPALATSERLLLQQRAVILQQLIAKHPEQVRAVMLPPETAAALLAADPNVLALLEREVSVSGELTRQIADDFDNHTHAELLQLHVTDQAGADLHVFTMDGFTGGHLQHHRVTLTGIASGDRVAAESIVAAVPSPRETVSNRNTVQHANTAIGNGALNCSPLGEQKVAVLMLRFPDNIPSFTSTYAASSYWQNAVTGPYLSVNDYWNALSYGKTTASADVYPVQLQQSFSCQDYLSLRTAALQAAQATVNLSNYTRIVLAFPTSTCTYGGLADVGCNAADTWVNHAYSVVWMPILARYSPGVAVWGGLAHELGHNLGLNHANTLDFGSLTLGPLDFQSTNPGTVNGTGATSATGAITAVDTEYGDSFSAMAVPWTGGPYSADHRTHQLGWIPSSGTDPGAATVISPGRYTLRPAEDPAGLRALRVLRDGISSSWLWVEYHQPDNSYTSGNLLLIPNQNETAGATIHYENGYGDPDKTWQLDMSPHSPPYANTFASGALLPGRTWSDPYSPLNISVESATATALVVNVGYDAPCATFNGPLDPIDAAGASGTVVVKAPAGCTWTASTNATWLSLSGNTTGSGDGSFRWTAAMNPGSGQRVTYLTVGRQSTRLLQTGSGAGIVSLLPQNGSAAPGASTVFTLKMNDAKGIADLGQVALDITGAGTDPCTVLMNTSGGAVTFYLYDRTNDAYSVDLPAGSSGSLSLPGCTLSGVRSSLTIIGSTAQFTLDLSFPADEPGMRSFFATSGMGDALPVGIFDAGASPSVTPPPPTSSATSSTVLSITPAAALPGSPVTLAATVSGIGGKVSPVGSVRFLEVSTSLGTATLDANGRATLLLSSLAVGPHAIRAEYSGDATYSASSSFPATVIVGKRTPILSIAGSATQVFVNEPVTLTVRVVAPVNTGPFMPSGQYVVPPSGTVVLQEGTAVLGSATLSAAGAATFPLPALPQGPHTFTAVYGGDALDTATAATGADVLVTDFTLTATSTPLTINAGAAVSITSTFLLTPGASGFPSSVTLTCSGAPARSLCSVTPGIVTPGSAAVPVTLQLQTTAATLRADGSHHGLGSAHSSLGSVSLMAAGFAVPVLGLLIVPSRRTLGKGARLLCFLLLALVAGGLNGCGSGGNLVNAPTPPTSGSGTPGTPAGNYMLTVTGTATGATTTLSRSASVQISIH